MSKSMLKRVAVQKGEQSSEALFLAADNAGKVAAANVVPVPMHIKGYAPIEDGVCGFGWVIVKPAFSAFAKFLMKNSHGSKAYGGGVYVGSRLRTQSLARNEAYAYAFAAVLQEAGITAYGNSRID